MRVCALAIFALLTAAAADSIKGNAFGDPRAPLLIEIFSDFECPACKTLHDNELPQLIRDYVVPGKAYLIYRYFPLDGHPYGRPAAELVCAAAQLGKYQSAVDALFASQQMWSADGNLDRAVAGALTASERQKIKTLLKSPAVQGEIAHDLEEGKGIPLQSTPTVLVTYRLRRYPMSGNGVLNYALLKALLDDLLKK